MMKSILFSLLLAVVGFSSSGQNLDIELLRSINVGRSETLDPAFKFVSASVYPIGIAAPTFFAVNALVKKDSTSKKNAFIVSSTAAISVVIATSLKYGVQRDRPYVRYSDLEAISHVTTPSFPSGHTSAAFAAATSITIAIPKWYVAMPAFIWAGSVGYSRMHLGVHYPSDVLAGAIIGSGSAWLSYELNKWYNRKNSAK
jgi:membrane-associated phospholipid phosphatase